MANIQELERILTYITDHPEEHVQSRWTCGTGACFAGHTALLNGYQALTVGIDFLGSMVVDDRGWGHRVRDVALKILDVDETTSEVLFDGNNTREMIAEMVKDIANGEHLKDLWHEDSEGVMQRQTR